jgi:hypothetical protein
MPAPAAAMPPQATNCKVSNHNLKNNATANSKNNATLNITIT